VTTTAKPVVESTVESVTTIAKPVVESTVESVSERGASTRDASVASGNEPFGPATQVVTETALESDLLPPEPVVKPAGVPAEPLLEPLGAVVDPLVGPLAGSLGAVVDPLVGPLAGSLGALVDPLVARSGAVLEPLSPVIDLVVGADGSADGSLSGTAPARLESASIGSALDGVVPGRSALSDVGLASPAAAGTGISDVAVTRGPPTRWAATPGARAGIVAAAEAPGAPAAASAGMSPSRAGPTASLGSTGSGGFPSSHGGALGIVALLAALVLGVGRRIRWPSEIWRPTALVSLIERPG
jgi:hypothetical protein